MTVFSEGDKVKVIANKDEKFKSYVGRRGKVVGSITPHTCRVKLIGDLELLFYEGELALDTGKADSVD